MELNAVAQQQQRAIARNRRLTDRTGQRGWGWRSFRAVATKVALVGVAVVSVGACTSLRLGYSFADTFLNFTLSRSFDLDDAQQAMVSESTTALLAWHRSTELASYAPIVQRMLARVSPTADGQVATLSAADFMGLQKEINAKMIAVGDRAAPDLAKLALTLTPAQLDTFDKRLRKEEVSERSNAASGVTSVETRVDKFVTQLEGWTVASLNSAQIGVVRQLLTNMPNLQTLWLNERELRNRELVAMLREIARTKPEREVAAGMLRGWFASLQTPSDPVRAASIQMRREANARILAEVMNLATPDQRQALQGKLRGYISDINALAKVEGNARG